MAVFDNVRYALSSSNDSKFMHQLSNLLNANGAVEAPVHLATHVVTPTLEFSCKHEAQADCVIVTPLWVERSQILGKMQDPKFFSPDPKHIFSGVHATTSGLSSHDLSDLISAITSLGGQYSSSYTRSTTHLFTLSQDSAKYECAMKHQQETGVKVLLPHWYSDSLGALVRMPEEPYEWPEPSVMSGAQLTKQIIPKEQIPKEILLDPELTDEVYSKKDPLNPNVFRNHRILISPIDDALAERIANASGTIVSDINEADVLITPFRTGSDYVSAFKKNERDIVITIGTPTWALYVLRTGKWSPPSERLLHYPVPGEHVRGFSKHEITITNYTGAARDYLKKLIILMGARYTATLSAKNTVVLAAHIQGAKTSKAREWSIPIANHLWLEECFAKWMCLPVGHPKYLNFPPGVDWSTVLGKRGLEKSDLVAGTVVHDIDGLGEKLEGRNWIDGTVFGDDAYDETVVKILDERRPLEEEEAQTEQPRDKEKTTRSPSKKPNSEKSSHKSKGQELTQRLTGISAVEVMEVDNALADLVAPIGKDEDDWEVVRATSEVDFNLDDEDDEIVAPKRRSSSRNARKRAGSMDKPKATTSKTRPKLPTKEIEVIEVDLESVLPKKPVKKAPFGPKSKTSKSKSNANKKRRPEEEEEESAASEEEEGGPYLRSGSKKHSPRKKSNSPPLDSDNDSITFLQPSPSPPKMQRKPPPPSIKPTIATDSNFSDDEISMPSFTSRKERENIPPGKVATKSHGISKRRVGEEEEESFDDSVSPTKAKAKSMGGKSPTFKATSVKREPLRDSSSKEDLEETPPKRPSTSKSKGKKPSASAKGKGREISQITKKTSVHLTAKDSIASPRDRLDQRLFEELLSEVTEMDSEEDEDHDQAMPAIVAPPKDKKLSKSTQEHRLTAAFGTATRSPSRRSAAAKAGEKLRDSVKDMNQYQQEMKRGVVRGVWEDVHVKRNDRGKRPSAKEQSPGDLAASSSETVHEKQETTRKRKAPPIARAASAKKQKGSSEENDEEVAPVKPARPARPLAQDGKKVKIIMTQANTTDSELKSLKRMGASIITDPVKCTHLITPKIGRTEKFLCAMAAAPFIITEEWAKDSVENGELQDESKYLLKDPVGEGKWRFKLSEALKRAKEHRGGLLKGHSFYTTKHTAIDPTLFRKIIMAHGGEHYSPSVLNSRVIVGQPNRHIISDMKDEPLWSSLAKENVPIYSPELVVTGVLLQRMDWERHRIG